VRKDPKVVDSNKELLEYSALLTSVLAYEEMPMQAALAGFAKELSLPNVELDRLGNTLFVTARGVEANKNKMVGRVINMDIGENLVDNYVKHLQDLQSKGITHYTYRLYMTRALPIIKKIATKMVDLGVPVKIVPGKTKEGNVVHLVYFKLGSSQEEGMADG